MRSAKQMRVGRHKEVESNQPRCSLAPNVHDLMMNHLLCEPRGVIARANREKDDGRLIAQDKDTGGGSLALRQFFRRIVCHKLHPFTLQKSGSPGGSPSHTALRTPGGRGSCRAAPSAPFASPLRLTRRFALPCRIHTLGGRGSRRAAPAEPLSSQPFSDLGADLLVGLSFRIDLIDRADDPLVAKYEDAVGQAYQLRQI